MKPPPHPARCARHPLPQGRGSGAGLDARDNGTRRRSPRAQRPVKTSAASATTTSRSTAGAAPRSTTSCASSTTSPAPRSSAWSATTAPPRTSSPPPRISSRTTRAGSARRCAPRTCPARRSGHLVLGLGGRSPRHRRGDRAAAARQLRRRLRPEPLPAARARRDRHPGARLVPDARVRGPLRHPRPALSGDRRPALLRAPGNPRRAGLSARDPFARRRPRVRAHRQRAQARARRRHRADAARPRPQAAHAADRSRARHGRDRRAQAEAAQLAARR